jgi:SRSO17 transposase
MERRFQARLDELLDDAEVRPGLLRRVLSRLEVFLEPFARSLLSPEQRANALRYTQGLLSDLRRKNAESIAYLHDRERQGLQKFLGQADWDHEPLLAELARQVGTELGEADGVLVFDPSAFPKKGTHSVGVARQYCGRLGKVDNCQVGIYLAYASRQEHALVDARLYLPREWTRSRKRLNEAGVPRDVRFRTRHELALQMLDEHGAVLPHRWVTGDDEMGRSSWFRQELRSRGERYLLAVPSNTLVRDVLAPEPPYCGQGRRRKTPFVRADAWGAALPEEAWETFEVRDGENGPLVAEAARTLVQAKEGGRGSGVAETLVVFRERQSNGTWKHDYMLSDTIAGATVAEFARVYKAEHRVEDCLKRAKSEAGLGDYQVRTWEGWHHHQALSLLATWFLTEETRRGKNPDARFDGAASPVHDRKAARPDAEGPQPGMDRSQHEPTIETQRGSSPLPLATAQPLAPATL